MRYVNLQFSLMRQALREAMLSHFVKAMDATHAYLIDLGAKLAPNKSFNFASMKESRSLLDEVKWSKLGGATV